MDTKFCKECGVDKPIQDFLIDKRVNGVSRTKPYCGDCRKQKQNKYYSEMTQPQKQRIREWRRTKRSKSKDFLLQFKQSPCTDCGIRYDPWIMEFDHLHDKVACISSLSFRGYSFSTLLKEIGKCEVVCANCHANRTYLRRNKLMGD